VNTSVVYSFATCNNVDRNLNENPYYFERFMPSLILRYVHCKIFSDVSKSLFLTYLTLKTKAKRRFITSASPYKVIRCNIPEDLIYCENLKRLTFLLSEGLIENDYTGAMCCVKQLVP
jgi:hypothetical protein